jgi:hypothetical protein
MQTWLLLSCLTCHDFRNDVRLVKVVLHRVGV